MLSHYNADSLVLAHAGQGGYVGMDSQGLAKRTTGIAGSVLEPDSGAYLDWRRSNTQVWKHCGPATGHVTQLSTVQHTSPSCQQYNTRHPAVNSTTHVTRQSTVQHTRHPAVNSTTHTSPSCQQYNTRHPSHNSTTHITQLSTVQHTSPISQQYNTLHSADISTTSNSRHPAVNSTTSNTCLR